MTVNAQLNLKCKWIFSLPNTHTKTLCSLSLSLPPAIAILSVAPSCNNLGTDALDKTELTSRPGNIAKTGEKTGKRKKKRTKGERERNNKTKKAKRTILIEQRTMNERQRNISAIQKLVYLNPLILWKIFSVLSLSPFPLLSDFRAIVLSRE